VTTFDEHVNYSSEKADDYGNHEINAPGLHNISYMTFMFLPDRPLKAFFGKFPDKLGLMFREFLRDVDGYFHILVAFAAVL